MNIQEKEELEAELYASWIRHPITVEMLKVFAQHRDSFIQELVNAAGNANVEDKQFRNLSYGLRTIHTMLKIITDFDLFKQHINKTNAPRN